MIHGYGEHGGRYEIFARRFVPLGYGVYACDLRGHGKSDGKRGHIDRFSDYLLDTAAFLDRVHRDVPASRTFLLGHRMGALVAALYAETPAAELPGLILSSPFLRLKMPVPAWKWLAALGLSRVAPALSMPSDIPLEWLTHDAAIVDATRRDSLNHREGTPRWFTETLRAQRIALAGAGSIRVPVALLAAGDDRIADIRHAERFFERLIVPKSTRRYEGYYHELFNETGREAVFQDIEDWLAERLTSTPGVSVLKEGGCADDRAI